MGAELFKIYSLEEARQTILKRRMIGEDTVPPAMEQSIARIFGEKLSPEGAVQRIIADVRRKGEEAVLDWTERIDGGRPLALRVEDSELFEAYKIIPPLLRDALQFAAERIRAFHQREPRRSWLEWREGGGALGQVIRPLEKVGIYTPGGSAPYPSTLIHCAVTARVAGVQHVIVCSPAGKDGRIAPIILAAAYIAKVDSLFRVGGAQAIAAMAFGTHTIPKVDKVVGPGNIFVALAKRQVYGFVDIDGIYGPTETLVVADRYANPVLIAADLLAQAEHDVLASAILVTDSPEMAQAVQVEIGRQLETLSRSEIIIQSLQSHSGAVICGDLNYAMDVANEYAPEHLCLHMNAPWSLLGRVKNAGGVFLGEHSYEVLGDYTAGPTHVMPTMGTARFSSPLSVRDFTKVISVIGLDVTESQKIAANAQILAEAEGLTAHANAVKQRENSQNT
jgi:histidinol dehydrogenase